MTVRHFKSPGSKGSELRAPDQVKSGGAGAERPQLSLAAPKEAAARADKAEAAAPVEARETSAESAAKVAPASEARSGKRAMILRGVAAAVLLSAAVYGYHYWTVGRFIVSTDDAYVGAYMSMVSPKIAANVVDVPVIDNETVKAGDVLVRLDDGDYKLALEQAQTKLATQKAAITTFDAQIRSAEAAINQARAQLDANRANLTRAEADFERTSTLAQRDFSSKSALDAARAARDSAKAQLQSQEAAITSAEANVSVLTAQKTQAEQLAKELDVAVAKAERDLSFTVIRAPFDGVVGNRNVQVGDYVTPGKRLAAVVPLDKIYVDANLKETQLANVKPGDEASVRVDALDGATLKGTVESVAPASGSQFSLLPPENATGNFTKIVQRVPVRIAIDTGEAKGKLRPGLSVVVDIDTRANSDAR